MPKTVCVLIVHVVGTGFFSVFFFAFEEHLSDASEYRLRRDARAMWFEERMAGKGATFSREYCGTGGGGGRRIDWSADPGKGRIDEKKLEKKKNEKNKITIDISERNRKTRKKIKTN